MSDCHAELLHPSVYLTSEWVVVVCTSTVISRSVAAGPCRKTTTGEITVLHMVPNSDLPDAMLFPCHMPRLTACLTSKTVTWFMSSRGSCSTERHPV